MEQFITWLNEKGYGGDYDDNDVYVVSLTDKQFGVVFSELESKEDFIVDENSSLVTEESTSLQYTKDNYVITLLDDGVNYSLTIKEN